MIVLYVVACLHGTLHGAPKDICREFAIRSYADKAICERAAKPATSEWLDGLKRIGIDPYVKNHRCAPREPGDSDL